MQPDYFAILRSLYELRIAKQVGAKANSLLLGLVWKANVLRFPDTLAIWNSEARDLAGLTDEELVTARNRLTQVQINDQFLLRYQSGGTRSPGRYQLNYAGLGNFFTPIITPEIPVNVPGNPLGNVGGNLQGNVQGNDGVISILTKQNERNKQNNSTSRASKTKQFDPSSLEYRLAEYLLKKIKLHLPNIKEPDLQGWASKMDLILRIDKRKPEEVKAVIDFAQGDLFWRSNILSAGKLRDKYDQLNAKRLNQKPTGKVPVDDLGDPVPGAQDITPY